MLNVIKAENLKCRHTFLKKMVVLAPLVVIGLSAVLTPQYLITGSFNWWCVIALPGFIALLAVLLNRYETKQKGDGAVFSLPVSLQHTWLAKVILLSLYVLLSLFLYLLILISGDKAMTAIFAVPQLTASIGVVRMAIAAFVLWLTYLWQVPFCLFLAKKFGMIGTILTNVVMGVGLGIAFDSKPLWWMCPYSWGTRLMVPLIKVCPNGLPAEAGNPLLDASVIPLGIGLSLVCYFGFTLVTMFWFEKRGNVE